MVVIFFLNLPGVGGDAHSYILNAHEKRESETEITVLCDLFID